MVSLVAVAVSSGWLPSALSFATALQTPSSSPIPARPVAVTPTATPIASKPAPTLAPPPTPTPTRGPDGCVPPPSDLQPAQVIDHGPRTNKVVALTFDDGNNTTNVKRILAFLVRNHVNATFFPTARAVELAPETWRTVARAGFPIGNHTYRHDSLEGKCFDAQVKELSRAAAIIRDQPLPLQPIMRPPYEEFDDNTRLAARATGSDYIVLWDVDTFDWTGVGRTTIANRALAGTRGSIVLMHTDSASTTAALNSIVDQYRKRGYSFVTVQQLLGMPGPVPYH